VEALCVFKRGSREQQLDILFKLIDVDGSRAITAMELFSFVSIMSERIKVNSHNIEGFPELQVNEDHLMEEMAQMNEEMADMSMVRKVQWLFRKLDYDGSGAVTIHEFKDYIAQDDEMYTVFRTLNPFTRMKVRPFDSMRQVDTHEKNKAVTTPKT